MLRAINQRNVPSRFFDAHEESIVDLSSFRYDETRRKFSFNETLKSLSASADQTKLDVKIASLKTICSNSRLTDDELKAIVFYLMEEPGREEQSVSRRVNRSLRSRSQSSIQPNIPFLQLLIDALNKLPDRKGTAWRFTRSNLTEEYKSKESFSWSGFSSCSLSKDILANGMTDHDEYTYFKIDFIQGKAISGFSLDQDLQEILLLPGASFQVTRVQSISDKLHFIDLRQVEDQRMHLIDVKRQDSAREQVESTAFHSETRRVDVPHEKCRFKSDKSWTEPQFVDNGQMLTIDDHIKRVKDPDRMLDRSILNRIKGSMFGLATGDALGAPFEFRPREYFIENPVKEMTSGGTWGLQKGQFTDDTSMGLCLAISLIARRHFVPYDQLVRYKWWQKYGYMSSNGHCFDIGAATSESLREFEQRQESLSKKENISMKDIDYLSDVRLLSEFNVQCSPTGAAGNGALMRLASVPLFFYRYPELAVHFSGQSSIVTHGDERSRDACRYYGALIVSALMGESKQQILDSNFYEKHRTWFGSVPLCQEVARIAQGSFKNKSGYDDGIRGKGFVLNSLEAALWAFSSDGDSFRNGCLKVINLGDDTDTTAAIYGQLAGAFYGYDQLPEEWTKEIFASTLIECICKWILYEGTDWKHSTADHSSIIEHQSRDEKTSSSDCQNQTIEFRQRTPSFTVSIAEPLRVRSTPTTSTCKSFSTWTYTNSNGIPFINHSYTERRDYPDYSHSDRSMTSLMRNPSEQRATSSTFIKPSRNAIFTQEYQERTRHLPVRHEHPSPHFSRTNHSLLSGAFSVPDYQTRSLIRPLHSDSHRFDIDPRTQHTNRIDSTDFRNDSDHSDFLLSRRPLAERARPHTPTVYSQGRYPLRDVRSATRSYDWHDLGRARALHPNDRSSSGVYYRQASK